MGKDKKPTSLQNAKGRFQKGHERVGGMPKGYKYYNNDLYPYLKANDVDPKVMLVKAMKGKRGPLSINEILKILEFCYAKKKPKDTTKTDNDVDDGLESSDSELGDYTYLLGDDEDDDA